MSYLNGAGHLNITTVEFQKVLNGFQGQATLADTEIVYFEKITNHSAVQGKHEFSCIMSRNGLGPYECKVSLSQYSQNYFLGRAEYKYTGPTEIFGAKAKVGIT